MMMMTMTMAMLAAMVVVAEHNGCGINYSKYRSNIYGASLDLTALASSSMPAIPVAPSFQKNYRVSLGNSGSSGTLFVRPQQDLVARG